MTLSCPRHILVVEGNEICLSSHNLMTWSSRLHNSLAITLSEVWLNIIICKISCSFGSDLFILHTCTYIYVQCIHVHVPYSTWHVLMFLHCTGVHEVTLCKDAKDRCGISLHLISTRASLSASFSMILLLHSLDSDLETKSYRWDYRYVHVLVYT